MRSGATGETAAAFAAELGIAETLLIGAGWKPSDRKSPFVWPPVDEQERRRAEIKDLAAKMAVEKAQEALAPTFAAMAKKALADAAVALGIMRTEKDGEGAKAIKEAAAIAKLGEFDPDRLADWIRVVSEMAAARLATEAQATKTSAPATKAPVQKSPATKAPTQKPPVPKAEGNGAETKSEAGGTIKFDTVAIAAKKDGSAVVEFWKAGRKYPEITWSLGAEKLLEQAPNMAETFDVDTLSAIGSTYAVAGTVQWEASEKLNAKGVPYKNLMNVVLG
jgi:hypothetical protein